MKGKKIFHNSETLEFYSHVVENALLIDRYACPCNYNKSQSVYGDILWEKIMDNIIVNENGNSSRT